MTNNHYFNDLLQLLNQDGKNTVTHQELFKALYIISAHKSLRAIVTSLRRFFELADRDARVFSVKNVDLAKEFALLRRISELDTEIEHFLVPHYSKTKQVHPLYGCTGDSAICELMLVTSELPEHESDYEKLLLWFCYLALHYYQIDHKFDQYKQYLFFTSTKKRPTITAKAVYNASRDIKYLGEAGEIETLAALVSIGIEPAPAINEKLGTVMTFDHHNLPLKKFCDKYDLSQSKFNEYREWLFGLLPRAMRALVEVVWSEKIATGKAPPSSGARQRQAHS